MSDFVVTDDGDLIVGLACQSCPEGVAPVTFMREDVERAEALIVEQGLDPKQVAAAVAAKLAGELVLGERACDDCKRSGRLDW